MGEGAARKFDVSRVGELRVGLFLKDDKVAEGGKMMRALMRAGTSNKGGGGMGRTAVRGGGPPGHEYGFVRRGVYLRVVEGLRRVRGEVEEDKHNSVNRIHCLSAS